MSQQSKKIRQPIITVLGHIDHGKTSLLDYIRGTLVQKREAAGITQHIGASYFPIQNILDFCGPKYKNLKINIPGLLVIDTPGHASFMNLRKRGGAVADIAILVIDITAGTMPITWESVRILRERKVPFVISANKIDLITGWKSIKNADFLDTYIQQPDFVKQELDEKIYRIVGDFIDEGFPGCDRYDKISDFTKNLAIVPTSAKTGEGISTLLAVIIGLVQKYLQERIQFLEGPAKGVILEVKQDEKLGTNLDCLIYDGILKKNQKIVIGGLKGPIISKIRAILTPKPMDEIRDPENKFDQQDLVYAAAGVKILAPNIDDAIAGAPLRAVDSNDNLQEVINEIESEISEIKIETDEKGVILKADTLGSLEALVKLFRENNVKIGIANIGNVSKKDIMDALAIKEFDPYYAVIMAFNVKILKDAEDEAYKQGIRIFYSNIIYKLLEDFKEYYEQRVKEEKEQQLSTIIRPGKAEIIPQCIFRRSEPAIFGIKVLGGTIKPKLHLINQDGVVIGNIKQIQKNNQTINEAKTGDEVAISIPSAVIGRNLKIEDKLYINIPESHVRLLRNKFRDELSDEEFEILKELINIMREKHSKFWGL